MTATAASPHKGRPRRSLGASQVAAAIGMHPYTTRIVLWQELVGELPPFAGNERTRWGNLLEPVVRDEYVGRRDLWARVVDAGDVGSVYHPDVPWARATPDAIIRREASDAWEYGLEIKTAGVRQAHRWGDPDGEVEVPVEYLLQCQWSMYVTGLPRWDIAVLLGGQEYRETTLERDDELLEMVVGEAGRFWRCVQERTPPDVDGTDGYRDYLIARYPHVRDEYVRAGVATEPVVADLREVRGQLRALEARKALLENTLRLSIGEASGMDSSHGRITCRPRAGRTSTDWQSIAEIYRQRHVALAALVAEMQELVDERIAAEDDVDEGLVALVARATCHETPSLARLIEHHTTTGKASRPLLVPRAWSNDA